MTRILGIETSCDETGVALVEDGRIVAARVATQEIHSRWGGVVPELASRLHLRTLTRMTIEIMRSSDWSFVSLDGVAATRGPGLIGALLVGSSFAKGLASALGIPYKGVNHLEGHLWASEAEGNPIPLPALALLVSGGHTELVRIDGIGDYHYLGGTLDDAAGEAFDKVGGLLGIAYPAGALLSDLANKGDEHRFRLPVAKAKSELDFSFSGLKTAAMRVIESLDIVKRNEWAPDFAASFQKAVIDQLLNRLTIALKRREYASLVLSGGVAANSMLRKKTERLATEFQIPVRIPSVEFCTDNGAMIAWIGNQYLEKDGGDSLTLPADPNLQLTGSVS